MHLIKKSKGSKIIFKGSRDGYKSKVFKELCGDQGPTLTIVKSQKFNEIFGGFTDIAWSKKVEISK
jgi:hypothetical protein